MIEMEKLFAFHSLTLNYPGKDTFVPVKLVFNKKEQN